MEAEDLLPCSQGTANCPYPKTDKHNPRPPILFLKKSF